MQAYIPEKYNALHRLNKSTEKRNEYELNLLQKSTSKQLWLNSTNKFFMTGLEKLLVLMVENVSSYRNYFNIVSTKYYNDYLN